MFTLCFCLNKSVRASYLVKRLVQSQEVLAPLVQGYSFLLMLELRNYPFLIWVIEQFSIGNDFVSVVRIFRMMMQLMQKLSSTKLPFWLAIANMKYWIYSTRLV